MTDDVPLLYASEPPSVQLMNTIWADREGVHDVLDSVAGLRSWARQAGLPRHGQVGGDDLLRARALRDALRRLAAAAVQDDRPTAVDTSIAVADARAVVNEVLATQSPWLSEDEGSAFRLGWQSSATGFEHTLAALALEGAELVARSSGGELKACHGPGCVLYFVKEGARREWCSAGCGNRARVARHYRRHRA